jgi:uncharacterized protein (TIGR04141 family)
MSKKKVYGLSVFLLKDSFADYEQAIKEVETLKSCDIAIGRDKARLYHKQNPIHMPKWVKLFERHGVAALNELRNTGTSAVLFCRHNKKVFALTFGYGRAMLKQECYEENFGLRIVLNTVDPEKLRSIDAQSLDAVPVRQRNQASVATSFSNFGLDIEQDIICAATGISKEPFFGKQITGKDSLKMNIPLGLNDLPGIFDKLFKEFTAEKYKKDFAWIDNLAEVRDHELLGTLDSELGKKIANNDFNRTWLAIPDIIDWTDASFKYRQPKRGEAKEDIDWQSYLDSIGTELPKTAETFRKQLVFQISESSGQEVASWPVYRCIHCELDIDGKSYVLNNSKWYRVAPDFLNSINSVVSSIPNSKINMPAYKDKNEGDYNRRVHDGNPDYYALMDNDPIRYDGNRSSIEFCDLYTKEKHLIHVKRYGGSSVLSHLFSQGMVATRILLSDADFRQKANEKLPTTHRLIKPETKPNAADFEVVFAIISNAKTKLELPFFSKVNLSNCYKQFQLMGMRVSLHVIPIDAGHSIENEASYSKGTAE